MKRGIWILLLALTLTACGAQPSREPAAAPAEAPVQEEPAKEPEREAPEKPDVDQIALADLGADAVRDRLRRLDINAMTPMQAMNTLFELKEMVDV